MNKYYKFQEIMTESIIKFNFILKKIIIINREKDEELYMKTLSICYIWIVSKRLYTKYHLIFGSVNLK